MIINYWDDKTKLTLIYAPWLYALWLRCSALQFTFGIGGQCFRFVISCFALFVHYAYTGLKQHCVLDRWCVVAVNGRVAAAETGHSGQRGGKSAAPLQLCRLMWSLGGMRLTEEIGLQLAAPLHDPAANSNCQIPTVLAPVHGDDNGRGGVF
jgi:hypothetical protein